jgi:hypothetical protein
MFLFYLTRHIRRSKNLIIIAALVFVLASLLGVLRYAVAMQREKRAAIERDFPITAEVSNILGTVTDGLDLRARVINRFTTDEDGTGDYFIDVCYKRTVSPEITGSYIALDGAAAERPVTFLKLTGVTCDGEDVRLVGVTRAESDGKLSPENGVTTQFRDGYSWEAFARSEPICLISDSVAPGTDTVTALMTVSALYTDVDVAAAPPEELYTTVTVPYEFKVAGTFHGGGGRIYCPWQYVIDEFYRGTPSTEVIRARIADNTRLAEIKAGMAKYFNPVNFALPPGAGGFALTVYDAQYISSHRAVTHNIVLLTLAQPVYLVLVAAIGLFAGFILLRGRRREYALMRCVGSGKPLVIALLTAEYAAAGLFGAAVCAAVGAAVPAVSYGTVFAPAVLLCFIAGVFAAELMLLRDSVLTSLQNRE